MRITIQATLEEQASMFRETMMISRDIMEQQVMVVISMVVLGNIFCNADLYVAFLRPKSNVDHVWSSIQLNF